MNIDIAEIFERIEQSPEEIQTLNVEKHNRSSFESYKVYSMVNTSSNNTSDLISRANMQAMVNFFEAKNWPYEIHNETFCVRTDIGAKALDEFTQIAEGNYHHPIINDFLFNTLEREDLLEEVEVITKSYATFYDCSPNDLFLLVLHHAENNYEHTGEHVIVKNLELLERFLNICMPDFEKYAE